MKPNPPRSRIRKTVKWGGLVGTAIMALVWLASGWWWGSVAMTANAGFYGLCVRDGYVDVDMWPGAGTAPARPLPPVAWSIKRVDHTQFAGRRFGIRPYIEPHGGPGPGWTVHIPIWIAALPLGIVALAAWRSDHRAAWRRRAGLCPFCSYDRRGLPLGAACPECGAGAAPA